MEHSNSKSNKSSQVLACVYKPFRRRSFHIPPSLLLLSCVETCRLLVKSNTENQRERARERENEKVMGGRERKRKLSIFVSVSLSLSPEISRRIQHCVCVFLLASQESLKKNFFSLFHFSTSSFPPILDVRTTILVGDCKLSKVGFK